MTMYVEDVKDYSGNVIKEKEIKGLNQKLIKLDQ